MVSQYFNSDRKPNPGGFRLLLPPPKDSCHRPHKLILLLGNRRRVMLGCPPETVGRRQGDGSQVHSKLSKGNLHYLNPSKKCSDEDCDKGNTEPVCWPVSQAEVAPHRLSGPMRKRQGRKAGRGQTSSALRSAGSRCPMI